MLPEQEAYLKTQIFIGDDGVAYNVLDLVKWAEENCDLQDIPTEELCHEFLSDEARSTEKDGSAAFIARAIKAEDYPIVVQRKSSGVQWVMDGRHRLWKRIFLDQGQTIKGYVISEDDLPAHAIDSDECLMYQEHEDARFDD